MIFIRRCQLKNLEINAAFFSHVIENRVQAKDNNVHKRNVVYVPSQTDNLIIRYIEYVEHFQHVPDKIKHLNYILSQVENSPEEISFLDTLHYYIKVPPIDIKSNRFRKDRSFVEKVLNFFFKDRLC